MAMLNNQRVVIGVNKKCTVRGTNVSCLIRNYQYLPMVSLNFPEG